MTGGFLDATTMENTRGCSDMGACEEGTEAVKDKISLALAPQAHF